MRLKSRDVPEGNPASIICRWCLEWNQENEHAEQRETVKQIRQDWPCKGLLVCPMCDML